MTSTILITTKDRKEELQRAVASALTQEAVTEILVFDDGSTDGTSDLIRKHFPSVRLERSDRPLGIVAARNRAVEMAAGEVIITIDDDCTFQSPDTVAATLNDFCDSRVGAVAIPHINVNRSPLVHSCPPQPGRVFAISEFAGGASAVRRDLFLRLGGFNPILWRQGEENDFCTRLLAHGFITRCGSAIPILHHESPHRDDDSIAFHQARCGLLYAWCDVPLWALLPHAIASAAKSLTGAYRMRLQAPVKGLMSAMAAVVSGRARRSPVKSFVYRTIRRLRRQGPLDVSSLAPSLTRFEKTTRGQANRAAPVAIVHNIPISYKHLLFSELVRQGLDFEVLFLASGSVDRIEFPELSSAPYRSRVGFEGRYEDIPRWHSVKYVWRCLGEVKPKAVIISGWADAGAWAAKLWCLCHRRPHILWAESNYCDHPRMFWREMIKRVFLQGFCAAQVYGISNAEYLVYLGFDPAKIWSKRSVADVGLFKFAEKSDPREDPRKIILFVGRLAPEKNLPFVLEALQRLPREVRAGLLLRIVGYGPLESSLRQQAERLGLNDVVEFAGLRKHAELAEVYHSSDIVLLPSTSEAWGLTVNEGMLCGLPAIVSNHCGCARDLINADTGWSFNPSDSTGFRRILENIAAMPFADLRTMGRHAAEVSYEYRAETCAKVVSACLSEVAPHAGAAHIPLAHSYSK
jgi:glycosyltransferase involved in cell wall biosynthesis